MRTFPLLGFVLVAGCANAPDASVTSPAAQAVIESIAARNSDVVRLTLHSVPRGKSDCWAVASTSSAKLGRRSDPEDLDAMQSGELVVLDEPGALDVTVPILMVDGTATAIAGVTLAAPAGADRDALIARARTLADEIAAAVRAADEPMW